MSDRDINNLPPPFAGELDADGKGSIRMRQSGRSAASLASLTLDVDTSLAAAATDTINIAAPAGMIGRVLSIRLLAIAIPSSSSGTHEFIVGYDSPGFGPISGPIITYGKAVYNAQLEFNYSYWKMAAGAVFPIAVGDQIAAVKGIAFSDATPLQILYNNNTDKAQPGVRRVRLVVEYESVI